ncbi:MAG: glycosyltransferase family 39 protein [Cyanobacteria bacterium J06632_22]
MKDLSVSSPTTRPRAALADVTPEVNRTQIASRSARYYLGLFAVALLMVGLRFFMLGHQSFWIDEGYTLYFSDGPTVGAALSRLLETDLSDRFHIPYYLIMLGWRHLFGDSEVAVRSFSTLCSIISAVLVYFTARYWFGQRYALWAFLTVSLSAYCIYYGQEARDYALTIMMVSAQLFAISRAFSQREMTHPWGANWGFKLLFAVFTALGMVLNVLMFCFSAGLALAHLLMMRGMRRWLSWWVPATVLSVLPVMMYLLAPSATSPDEIGVSRFYLPLMYNVAYAVYGLLAGTTFAPPQILLRTGSKLAVVTAYWPMLAWFAATFAVIATGFLGYWLWRWHRHRNTYTLERFLTYTLAISFALGVMLAYVTKLNWLPRHVFYVAPVIALLLPALFRHVPVSLRGANALVRIAACSLVAINVVSLGNYYFGDLYQRDDFRAVAQYVSTHVSDGVQSVLIGGAGDTRLMTYYGSPDTLDGKYITPTIQTGGFAENVADLTNDAREVLLVSNREYVIAEAGEVVAAMEQGYELLDLAEFHYFKVYHFQKQSV